MPLMFNKRRFVVLLIALATLFAGESYAIADNPPRKILTGWIPYYSKTGLSSAVTNADIISEVSPFWYSLTSETKIVDQYALGNPSVPISVPISTLRSMNFKILPTITDGTSKGILAALLAKDSARSNIVQSILTLINQNGYDGIDLDFENFAFVDGNTTWPTTAPLWTAFVKDLSTALHAQNKLLSITSPVAFDPASGKRGYYVYSWPAISNYIDRLRIMAYDYSVAKVGPIGPINWTEDAVRYAASVISPSKIYIGIPGYGRDWVTAVNGTCPSDVASIIKVGAKAATFVMRDALNLAASYGATPIFDNQTGENTFTYQKTYIGNTTGGAATQCTATRTAWFQDAKSFTLRGQLVLKYQLAGLAEWSLGMEDAIAQQALHEIAKSVVNEVLTVDNSNTELGTAINMTGTFILPNSTPATNLPVRVEGKNSTSDWRQLYSTNTAQDGTIKLTGFFGENTSLRLASDGTPGLFASQSPSIDIKVSRAISWKAPASIKHGVSYSITGQVQPKVADINIKLLMNNGLLATAMTDVDGRFTIPINYDKIGFVNVKLAIDGDTRFSDSNSTTVQILVR